MLQIRRKQAPQPHPRDRPQRQRHEHRIIVTHTPPSAHSRSRLHSFTQPPLLPCSERSRSQADGRPAYGNRSIVTNGWRCYRGTRVAALPVSASRPHHQLVCGLWRKGTYWTPYTSLVVRHNGRTNVWVLLLHRTIKVQVRSDLDPNSDLALLVASRHAVDPSCAKGPP